MSLSLIASLERSGYYRLEAYSEFINSHTDHEQCEPLAFKLFCSVRPIQDVQTWDKDTRFGSAA